MDRKLSLVNEQWPFFTEAERNTVFQMAIMALGLRLIHPRRWCYVLFIGQPIIIGR